jgi:nitrous oxide reductase accessory protein NosL
MLVHLGAPSRHGEAAQIFVEVLLPSEDPMQTHTGPHPWKSAERAHYVVGVPRRSIMGPPILSYADAASATEVALAHPGAQSLDFDGLKRWWRERN